MSVHACINIKVYYDYHYDCLHIWQQFELFKSYMYYLIIYRNLKDMQTCIILYKVEFGYWTGFRWISVLMWFWWFQGLIYFFLRKRLPKSVSIISLKISEIHLKHIWFYEFSFKLYRYRCFLCLLDLIFNFIRLFDF